MALNVAAILVILASVVFAAALLRRHLPRPGGVGAGVACVRCGAPAHWLWPDSFACPGCGQDVREMGLADPARRAGLRPLWRAMLYTIAVLIAAPLTTGVARSVAPKTGRVVASGTLVGPQSRAYAGVEVAAVREGPEKRPDAWSWQLSADLSGLDGRAYVFDAGGPPDRWSVIGPDGKPLASGDVLDDAAVLSFLRAAVGARTDDQQLTAEAFEVARAFESALEQPVRARPPRAVPFRTSFGSRTSRLTRETVEPAWVVPAVTAAWSAVWVAGLWAVLRVSGRRRLRFEQAAEPPARETDPGGAA